jgi:hypothetical protein
VSIWWTGSSPSPRPPVHSATEARATATTGRRRPKFGAAPGIGWLYLLRCREGPRPIPNARPHTKRGALDAELGTLSNSAGLALSMPNWVRARATCPSAHVRASRCVYDRFMWFCMLHWRRIMAGRFALAVCQAGSHAYHGNVEALLHDRRRPYIPDPANNRLPWYTIVSFDSQSFYSFLHVQGVHACTSSYRVVRTYSVGCRRA